MIIFIKSSYYNIYLAAHPVGHLSVIDQQKMEKENENESEGEKERQKGEMDPNRIPTPYFTSQICNINHPLDDIYQRVKTY